jgi:transcriptional regulator with XRE-family HTH domain
MIQTQINETFLQLANQVGSSRKVAEIIETSESAVSKIVHGERVPNLLHLHRLAKNLNIDIHIRVGKSGILVE